MGYGRPAACGLVLVVATATAFAGTKLQVTYRPVRDSARVTYASTDALAGLDKGSGTDPSAIAVQMRVRHDATSTRFVVPAGPYDGRAGWTHNDAGRAVFVNRDAPDGPASTLRTTFAVGRRVKLVAKSLGDLNPLGFGPAIGSDVEIAYVVANGAETKTHCTRFAASSCRYTPLDAETGYKVRCTGGTADLACGAQPVCGNGIRESGEQCDGGVGCTSDCRQGLFSCCQGAGQCIAAPVFSLQFYLFQYCGSFLGGSQPWAGQMCQPDGTCADAAIEPVPVCCQLDPTTCQQGSGVSSIAGLWYAQYGCLGGSGIGGGRYIVINGTCGDDGVCTAN
jgi:hypothetical protein